MTPHTEFVMLQCQNPECRFRCPSNLSQGSLDHCPLCGSQIKPDSAPFTNPKPTQQKRLPSAGKIEVLLDNLRSTLNVGSIMRTSDGAGVDKIHLCGTTPTPEHPKIAKTSLGAEIQIPWQYHRNGLDLVGELQTRGYKIIALEVAPNSIPVFAYERISESDASSILLVVGNEVSGIDPQILAESDLTLSIPMMGFKTSLNVAVAFGIAVYTIQRYQFAD